MRDYAVIYERGNGGWRAYAPDLPGLGVAAETFDEVDHLIREGIVTYIESLLEDSLSAPEATTIAATVSVALVPDGLSDPLLAVAGLGTGMWQGKDADEYIADLRSKWEDR